MLDMVHTKKNTLTIKDVQKCKELKQRESAQSKSETQPSTKKYASLLPISFNNNLHMSTNLKLNPDTETLTLKAKSHSPNSFGRIILNDSIYKMRDTVAYFQFKLCVI